jgi:hypothetical protein
MLLTSLGDYSSSLEFSSCIAPPSVSSRHPYSLLRIGSFLSLISIELTRITHSVRIPDRDAYQSRYVTGIWSWRTWSQRITLLSRGLVCVYFSVTPRILTHLLCIPHRWVSSSSLVAAGTDTYHVVHLTNHTLSWSSRCPVWRLTSIYESCVRWIAKPDKIQINDLNLHLILHWLATDQKNRTS